MTASIAAPSQWPKPSERSRYGRAPLKSCLRNSRTPICESTYSLVEWAEAEVVIGKMRAWPAEMFSRSPQIRFATNPVDGSAPPDFAEGELEVGTWVLRDGVPVPKCQQPDAIYAYLTPFRGRTLRNPAYAVLKRHGLVSTDKRYKAWLDTMSKMTDEGRVLQDPQDEGTNAARFRKGLEDWVTAKDGRLEAICEELAAECKAMNVPYEDDDALISMLDSPWVRVVAPASAMVQAVRLGGQASPSTLFVERPTVLADLYDLGEAFDSVPRARVDELVSQVQCGSRRRAG